MKGNRVYLITGERAAGKTTRLRNLAFLFRDHGISVGGFFSEGYWENNIRTHYRFRPVWGEELQVLCSRDKHPEWIQTGTYFFNPEAVQSGKRILESEAGGVDLLVIDEVGMLETRKQIWYESLQYLLNETDQCMLWSVRKDFSDRIIEFFEIKNPVLLDV
ncbi:MAG: nucleoside-triphosphatase, partial [Bacteroidales bacterium]|nr:nucleoside-triphosphatase [Bacteroidales bacterium]